MTGAFPYWSPPVWGVDLPFIGTTTIGLFGVLVVLGIMCGARASRFYARTRGIDPKYAERGITWALVCGFIGAHLVALLAYHPERVVAQPWSLLLIPSGIASTGGFLGALVGVVWVAHRNRFPLAPLADVLTFGILVGFPFGRLGCALTHDHPGIVTDASNWLAVGPWPDGSYRYDLGLIELFGFTTLALVMTWWFRWRHAPAGMLSGTVGIVYGAGRFPLDFLRAVDVRYAGLTFAQYACIFFVLFGILACLFSNLKDDERVEPV